MRPLVTAASALVAILAALSSAHAANPVLPDTVLATVGRRTITRTEFQRQWERFYSAPTAPLEERQRQFLDQLVDKELLVLATADMGFEPDAEQAARLALVRQSAMRQVYYRMMVTDSLPPAPAVDPHGHAASADEEERAIRAQAAEQRMIRRLIAPLEPTWDDSTAALLARAFTRLPKPKEEGVGWVRWNYTAWMPPVADADTSRLLGRSRLGPFSVGLFLYYWARVPAGQRDRPDSVSGIEQWAESFLAQGILDQEAGRLGLDRMPEVEAEVAKQRQMMALDAYYRRHVSIAVDTSEKRLRAVYAKSPHAFDGMPSALYEALWYRRFDEASAGFRMLSRGARWDSVLSARFPMPADAEGARLTRSERDLYKNPMELLPTNPDTTLARLFRGAKKGQVFGPRDRAGQWWVYRFLERRDGKRHNFQEARATVAEKVAFDDEERALRAHLVELRSRYAVRVNAAGMRALAEEGSR